MIPPSPYRLDYIEVGLPAPTRWDRVLFWVTVALVTAVAVLGMAVRLGAGAHPAPPLHESPITISASPTEPDPPVSRAEVRAPLPAWLIWAASPDARHVEWCESRDVPTASNGSHFGLWQFDLSTWRSVGGTGDPRAASIAEQDARAYRLWQMRGWQPWQCRVQ